MEEARKLLERLERIDELSGAERRPEALLAELRALVVEAEAWARREQGAEASTGSVIDALRHAVDRSPPAGEPPDDGLASAPHRASG
jgi:hypothetical protein